MLNVDEHRRECGQVIHALVCANCASSSKCDGYSWCPIADYIVNGDPPYNIPGPPDFKDYDVAIAEILLLGYRYVGTLQKLLKGEPT